MNNNEEKETDLHGINEPDLEYEAAKIPVSNDNTGRNRRFRGSLWSLPPDGFTIYKRTANDIFSDVVHRILGFFMNTIDFLRVFIYNLYCKIKHHERIKTVKKSTTTKQENTNSNTRKWYQLDWKATGRGIIGLGLFLSVASMVLSAVIIYKGTDDLVPKVVIAPMAIHAFIILVKVFVSFTHKGDK